MKRKIVKGVAVAFCVILLLLLLFWLPIGAYLSIVLEDVFVKWDIDNPYVNDQYAGWEEFHIDGVGTMMLPEEWTVKEENGIRSVFDASGNLWATGTVYGTEEACFDSYQEFVATFSSIGSGTTVLDPYPQFAAMKGADIDIFTISDIEGKKESYYVIQLRNIAGGSFALFLFANLNDSPIDFEIAEAIAYSFAYK